jgi:hypothetical protein
MMKNEVATLFQNGGSSVGATTLIANRMAESECETMRLLSIRSDATSKATSRKLSERDITDDIPSDKRLPKNHAPPRPRAKQRHNLSPSSLFFFFFFLLCLHLAT